MKETDYYILTNRVNISNALKILSDVMAGNEYRTDQTKFRQALKNLREIEQELFSVTTEIVFVDKKP